MSVMGSPIQSLYYQVILPHPLLSPYIRCYWVLRLPAGQLARHELILPDGYAELILNYGQPYTWRDQYHKTEKMIRTVHLVGERDASIVVNLREGLDQVGIKFKPVGLFALLRRPLDELANQMVEAHELNQQSIQELNEQVFESPSDTDKVKILDSFFMKQLLVTELPDLQTRTALKLILNHQGNIRIDKIASYLNVHYKTLERKFKTYVGLSPKVFARIVRFKYAYKQFHSISLQNPSFFLDLGYYDQNHFIKDFKYFMHTTPFAYLRKKGVLSDEIVRRGLVERSQAE